MLRRGRYRAWDQEGCERGNCIETPTEKQSHIKCISSGIHIPHKEIFGHCDVLWHAAKTYQQTPMFSHCSMLGHAGACCTGYGEIEIQAILAK